MSLLLENFDFIQPTSLAQFKSLVREYGEQNQRYGFFAGGTDIIPKLKNQTFKLDKLINLGGLQELNRIEKQDHHIVIGALTTLSHLASSDIIQKYLPCLRQAAHKVASPQIRNRATLGGNVMVDNRCIYINQSRLNRECHTPCFKADGDVCHLVKSARQGDDILCVARFVSDTAPVLLLLEAKINITGPDGTRNIKLAKLYRQDGIDSKNLKQGEIITSFDIKIPENSGLHYEKLAIRNALDFPSLGVAVRLTEQDVSVALTGLNTLPGVFHGKAADYGNFEEMVTDICGQASDFAKTYQQDFFPRAYRKQMIPVFIRRGIDTILKDRP